MLLTGAFVIISELGGFEGGIGTGGFVHLTTLPLLLLPDLLFEDLLTLPSFEDLLSTETSFVDVDEESLSDSGPCTILLP